MQLFALPACCDPPLVYTLQAVFMSVGDVVVQDGRGDNGNDRAFQLIKTLVEDFGLTTPRLIISVSPCLLY